MSRDASADPTSRPPGEIRWVVGLAVPAIAHMALIAATFVGDRVIVGRDPEALAALHLPSTVAWALTSVLASLGVAAMALVGRAQGRRDEVVRSAAVAACLRLARRAGLGAALAAVLLALPLLSLLPTSLRGEALLYSLLVLPAMPLSALEAASAGCLHATGDTRTPLVVTAMGSLVHLAVTFTLFEAGLGIAGAALGATAGFALQAWGSMRAANRLRRAPATREAIARASGSLARLALPAAGERLGYHLGYLGYAAAIAGLGPAAMAANQALLGFEALAYPIAEGCGIAAASLVAQRLGAGRSRAAIGALGVGLALAIVCSAAFALPVAAAPVFWAGLLSHDPTVVDLAAQTLPVLALAQPAMAFAVVGAMALRGAGATGLALAITAAGTTLRLIVTWTLCYLFDFGLAGAWWASAFDWGFQTLAVGGALARRLRPETGAELAASARATNATAL